jgi:hypothetical protein
MTNNTQRLEDLRTTVELGRKHPLWFKENLKVFAILRDKFIPSSKEKAAWDLDASLSDSELAAWESDEHEMNFIMGHIGAAWRMTAEYPWTLQHPAFKPSLERAVSVQQMYHKNEPLAYVMQLETVLTMATGYCFRKCKCQSIDEWLSQYIIF